MGTNQTSTLPGACNDRLSRVGIIVDAPYPGVDLGLRSGALLRSKEDKELERRSEWLQ